MASYIKRQKKDGSCSYRIRVCVGRDKHGKQITKYYNYKPKATTPRAIEKEIQQAASAFEEKAKQEKYLNIRKLTFEEFTETWKQDWARRNLTERIYQDYTTILTNAIFPEFGEKKLSEIKPMHVQAFVNAQEERGLSPKTVRQRFGVLNSVMKYAFRMEIIEANPCTRCELPKVKVDTKLHFFTPEQARRFLNDALTMEYEVPYGRRTRTDSDGNQYVVTGYTVLRHFPYQMQVYYNLAVYGAFRRGELVALTWEDVDFEERTISINKSASKLKGKQIIKEPKTVAGNRVIAVPDRCVDMLCELRREQLELSMKLGSAWEGKRGKNFDKNFVFITDTGGMMNLDTPSHTFKRIVENYNNKCEREEDKLPIIRLHDLRHTSATLLLAEGVDIETVSHRLGHSKASITLDVYGHALPEVDRSAAQKLDEMINTDCG